MARVSDIALDILNELHTEHLAYQSEYLPLVECVNACSEYEDTGLTPDEINQIKSENAELKARLEKAVELPCKVGSVLYEIVLGIIEKRTVSGFAGGETVELIYTVFEFNGKGYCRTFEVGEFGKTVFLTEAEAQSKLEEMKGDKL